MTDPAPVSALGARRKRAILNHVANSQEIYRRAEKGRRRDFERALERGVTVEELAAAAGLEVAEVRTIAGTE